jgi:hypothetical protein
MSSIIISPLHCTFQYFVDLGAVDTAFVQPQALPSDPAKETPSAIPYRLNRAEMVPRDENESQDEEKVEDWNRLTKRSLESSRKEENRIKGGQNDGRRSGKIAEDRHSKRVGQKVSLHHPHQSEGEKR